MCGKCGFIIYLNLNNNMNTRTALIIGGFIALGLIVAGALFGFELGLWFSVGMVVLATGSKTNFKR